MNIGALDSVQSDFYVQTGNFRHVMVVAAMERLETARSVELLRGAGFPPERVDVMVVEEVPRLEERLGGSGLHRFLVRLRLIRGDDFDEMEEARRELMNGRALVQVTVIGRHEFRLAKSILGVTNIQSMTLLSGAPVDSHQGDEWAAGSIPPPSDFAVEHSTARLTA